MMSAQRRAAFPLSDRQRLSFSADHKSWLEQATGEIHNRSKRLR